MQEIVIKYKNKKTLEALRDLAKYLDYEISLPATENKDAGITIIPGDSSIDVSELTEVFTGKNIDAVQLRKDVWQRTT